MLSTISESVFSRAAHFILELLQNAEDAGARRATRRRSEPRRLPGEIEFRLSKTRVKVSHNGSPFTDKDVDAICGVRSTKKPAEGTLGFLGIGFKSVFKITDCPQVYSGGFQFRFDKEHWKTSIGAQAWPWQIAPLWVDEPPEPIDQGLTTFILPFRSEQGYEQTAAELKRLDVHIFLFLRWLKRLRVLDDTTGKTTILENRGVKDQIVTLRRDGVKQRFVTFRQVSRVPSEVAADPALEFYKRDGVKSREIVLAFAVDKDGRLASIEDASTLGSVSSFLPLTEERSGARFLIQSDFLVQPGREAIQYELAWNHWLVGEAAEAAKGAIEHFKRRREWRTDFLGLFDFRQYVGQAAFDRLFYPKLHAPLMTFLESAEVYPTAEGLFVAPEKAVHADGELAELLQDSDLPMLFPEETDLHLVDPHLDVKAVPAGLRARAKTVTLGQVARSKPLLERKLQEANHVQWFRKLYKAMEASTQYFKQEGGRTSRGRIEWYESPIYVLTDRDKLELANAVYVRDIPNEVIELRKRFKEVETLFEAYHLIHPQLAIPELSKFFLDRTHVGSIDYDKICRSVFLPKLRLSAPAPRKAVLIAYTRLLQKGPTLSEQIWVLTKAGRPKASNQVFMGNAYSPAEDWERNRSYVRHMDILGEDYLEGVRPSDVAGWKTFFCGVGARERADNPYVEQFALAFVEAKLSPELRDFIAKHRQQHGYDREATRTADGSQVQLEIKGQKTDQPVQLVGNEPDAARRAARNRVPFWVCVVSGIPENPRLWVVENPLDVGKSTILTIDVTGWKTHGRRIR